MADTTTDIPALIADVPTIAEFEARTLVAADYVVVGDTVAAVTTVTTVNGLANGAITAAAIATGAIDADALAADAGAEIADAVWDEAIAGHAGAAPGQLSPQRRRPARPPWPMPFGMRRSPDMRERGQQAQH